MSFDSFAALREYAEAERERANEAEARYQVLTLRLELLAGKWESEDDTTQWGSHDKSACARALRAALGGDGS